MSELPEPSVNPEAYAVNNREILKQQDLIKEQLKKSIQENLNNNMPDKEINKNVLEIIEMNKEPQHMGE